MVAIKNRLANTYGIALDNQAGIDSIKLLYTENKRDAKALKKLQATRWKLSELRGVETGISRYSPLLGANRNAALGDQTITTFSRLKTAANNDASDNAYVEGEGGTDASTFAETFTQTVGGETMSNVGIFDASDSVTDFAGDPHNPTPEELEKGYIGTVVHELCHGLIESLPAPATAPDYPDGTTVTNIINHFANSMAFWDDTNTESGTAGAEEPITQYGKDSAEEDMAEAVMFFFEDPGELQRECPERFNFIKDLLVDYLDPTAFQESMTKVRNENPQLNPPPLPAAPAAPAAAPAPNGGITPAALQEGAANLKSTPASALTGAVDDFQSAIAALLQLVENALNNPQPEEPNLELSLDEGGEEGLVTDPSNEPDKEAEQP